MLVNKVFGGGGSAEKDMLQARVDATNSCYYLFYQYSGTELDISRLDTSNVTDMRYMFSNCANLTAIDVSNFDTRNVTKIDRLFFSCGNLKSLNLSNFDIKNVTNLNNMFTGCRKLEYLDISNFDTKNVTFMSEMFSVCTNLTTVQGILDLYSTTSNTAMFNATTNLTGVTLKNIRTSLQIGNGTNYGHKWELSYLINAVKECWDLSSGTQKTLTIGSANLEKIANVYVKLVTPTAEQIEADPYITNKLPCIECASTDEGAMTLTAYAGLKNWVLA